MYELGIFISGMLTASVLLGIGWFWLLVRDRLRIDYATNEMKRQLQEIVSVTEKIKAVNAHEGPARGEIGH